jgi:haloacid dehalogenase-like hydrolase
MKNNVRLVIADVDGTLVTQEKVLTARAVEAVKRLKNAGIAFSITSGRPPLGMKMLIDPLGHGTSATTNSMPMASAGFYKTPEPSPTTPLAPISLTRASGPSTARSSAPNSASYSPGP